MLPRLIPLTEENKVILNLVACEEYKGFFARDCSDSEDTLAHYTKSLFGFAQDRCGVVLELDGKNIGFILADASGIMVSGLLPEYRGNGYMNPCRNTFIHVMCKAGFMCYNTVSDNNIAMKKLMEKVPCMKIESIRYPDPVYLNLVNGAINTVDVRCDVVVFKDIPLQPI